MKILTGLVALVSATSLVGAAHAQLNANVVISGTISNVNPTFLDNQFNAAVVGDSFSVSYQVPVNPTFIQNGNEGVYDLTAAPVTIAAGSIVYSEPTPAAMSRLALADNLPGPRDVINSTVNFANGLRANFNTTDINGTLISSPILAVNGTIGTGALLPNTVLTLAETIGSGSYVIGGISLVITVPNIIGTTYCTSLPNITGAMSQLTAVGSTVASANNLTLLIANMPPQYFGIALASRVQGMTPLNEGILCLSGLIGRFSLPGQIFQADTQGNAQFQVPLTMIPQGAQFTAAMAGENWNFQVWHRDIDPTTGGNSANFTDALQISFM